jgi:hypothetical protein
LSKQHKKGLIIKSGIAVAYELLLVVLIMPDKENQMLQFN